MIYDRHGGEREIRTDESCYEQTQNARGRKSDMKWVNVERHMNCRSLCCWFSHELA